MLAHGGASSPRVRYPSLRHPAAEQPGLHRPARNDSFTAPVAGRAPDPDDRGNVATAVISDVFPTF